MVTRLLIMAAVPFVLFFLVLLLPAFMTVDSYPVLTAEVARKARVPAELLPAIKWAAQDHGLPWADLAAYLALTHEYRLPIPSRSELAGAPDVTREDRHDVEARWTSEAYRWLKDLLARLGPDLEEHLPEEQRAEFRELRDWLTMADELRLRDPEEWRLLAVEVEGTPVLGLLEWPYLFPVDGGTFTNDWGYPRPQNLGWASTRHEGTDIFAPRGTPVRSVADGTIEVIGWNYLGGWAVSVRDATTGVLFYYAHLDRFAWGIFLGQEVSQGSVLGYVGTSGQGPEGTADQIATPHLHFGIYLPEGATNPYPYLVAWREQP